ncbi:hypothetical protein H4R23_003476 [Coemansia sp. Cherry 401B]|nr:hypothetical protein H4R23_003476 [Coemansia sp. Cherry 401B]
MQVPYPDGFHHGPRPRGRPPLGDKQRSRLTLKLSGARRGADARPEPEETEAQLEEQFVLRVLPEMAGQFGKLVGERQIHEQLTIRFRDARNAVVGFAGQQYLARLVDLPTISEAYRTVDKKQLLKTADVCQMLVVERAVGSADAQVLARGLDVVWADGLAAPLADVRRRRFRPRMPQGKIDAIEQEVLRLLEADAQAAGVKLDVYDEQGDEGRGATPSIDVVSPVALHDLATPMAGDEDAASSVAEDLEFDETLAAELEQGLEGLGDEDEDDEDDEESDDEDEPNSERAMQVRLLGEEIAELELTVARKRADLDSAPNPIIRKRFEDIIRRLQQELDDKQRLLAHYSQEGEVEGGDNDDAEAASGGDNDDEVEGGDNDDEAEAGDNDGEVEAGDNDDDDIDIDIDADVGGEGAASSRPGGVEES